MTMVKILKFKKLCIYLLLMSDFSICIGLNPDIILDAYMNWWFVSGIIWLDGR